MKKGLIIGIAIPTVIALTFGIMTWSSYNSLVRAEKSVELASSDILTALTARNSTLTNILSAVDAYLDHESDLYEMITDARTQYFDAIESATTQDLVEADALTSLALTNLFAFAVSEDNPDPQAADLILSYMATIETQEYIIKNAREDYNEAANAYNTDIVLFPKILFAKMFGFEEVPMWKMTSGEDIVIVFPEQDA
ncbi:MAG: LemA family protein [Bacilli bacterium]|jgi:LemA protein